MASCGLTEYTQIYSSLELYGRPRFVSADGNQLIFCK